MATNTRGSRKKAMSQNVAGPTRVRARALLPGAWSLATGRSLPLMSLLPEGVAGSQGTYRRDTPRQPKRHGDPCTVPDGCQAPTRWAPGRHVGDSWCMGTRNGVLLSGANKHVRSVRYFKTTLKCE